MGYLFISDYCVCFCINTENNFVSVRFGFGHKKERKYLSLSYFKTKAKVLWSSLREIWA